MKQMLLPKYVVKRPCFSFIFTSSTPEEAKDFLIKRRKMMKNYAAIFLLTIISLTASAGFTSAQEVTDSYFANQVKLSKPATKQQKENTTQNGGGPSNDNLENAETIVLSSNSLTLLKTNIDATKEANEPNHAENAGGKSVWFDIIPTTTQVVRIETKHALTNFDTTLAVYGGFFFGSSFNRVGYNDDCMAANCGTSSMVELKLEAGTLYRIAVDGYNGNGGAESGVFVLTLTASNSPVSHDNIGSAFDLGTTHAGSIAGTYYAATNEANEPAHSAGTLGGQSVWYRFQTNTRRAMTFEVKGNITAEMAVYVSTSANPTFAQLTRLDDNRRRSFQHATTIDVNFAAVPNQYYFIAIDNNVAQDNPFEIANFQLKFYQTKLRYSMRMYDDAPVTSMNVFRPSEGRWYNVGTTPANIYDTQVSFGLNGDVPVPADFDGDALTNFAVTRNQNGLKHWYVLSQNSNTQYSYFQWGLASDKAVTGDFDRDGIADAAVIRNAGGTLVWYVRQSTNGALRNFVFGITGDKPVIADFDGDGATDVVVTRLVDGNVIWHVLKSGFDKQLLSDTYTEHEAVSFGSGSDTPAAEDFDADGKTDYAVFRQVSGTWYILRSSTNQVQTTQFGQLLDKPQPADYDGDGKADLAVYRASEGKWYFWYSVSDEQKIVRWGVSSDIPVSSMNTLSQ